MYDHHRSAAQAEAESAAQEARLAEALETEAASAAELQEMESLLSDRCGNLEARGGALGSRVLYL